MNPRQAVRRRNADALMDAFSNLQEVLEFRNEVLPYMRQADCLWFWRQTMTPEQLDTTFDAMRDVVLSIASIRGLIPDQVQGGYQDSTPVMYVTTSARDQLFAEIPKERHSFLNALLIDFPS